MKKFIFAVLVILLVVLVSCEKEPIPGPPPVTYAISTTVVGKGSVVPDKLPSVNLGSSVNFKFTPESEYSLYSVKINGVKVEDIYPSSTEVQYTVRDVNTNLNVEVTFVKTEILLLSKLEPALMWIKLDIYRADNDTYIRSSVLTQAEKSRKYYHHYPSMDMEVKNADGTLYWKDKWNLTQGTYQKGGQIFTLLENSDMRLKTKASPIWSNADNCYAYAVYTYERI